MTSSLDEALNETLGVIQRALDHIRAGDGAEAELRNVHACLLNILELVERDPGIEAATDDLYASAKELALGRDKGARMARLMESSMLRLRERLAHALPRSADGARWTNRCERARRSAPVLRCLPHGLPLAAPGDLS